MFFWFYSNFDPLAVLKGWSDKIQLRFSAQLIESAGSIWFLKYWLVVEVYFKRTHHRPTFTHEHHRRLVLGLDELYFGFYELIIKLVEISYYKLIHLVEIK